MSPHRPTHRTLLLTLLVSALCTGCRLLDSTRSKLDLRQPAARLARATDVSRFADLVAIPDVRKWQSTVTTGSSPSRVMQVPTRVRKILGSEQRRMTTWGRHADWIQAPSRRLRAIVENQALFDTLRLQPIDMTDLDRQVGVDLQRPRSYWRRILDRIRF